MKKTITKMKKTIEINYGTSITLNKGNYENFKPMWHQKVTIELNGQTEEEAQKLENQEFDRIKANLDKRAQDEWDKSKLDLSGLRIRLKDGKKYPSVTSILNHDKDLSKIDPEYSIRGTEIHNIFNEWIDSMTWKEPQASLIKLKYEDIKYKEFISKFKVRLNFDAALKNIEVYNDKYLFSGEVDFVCLVDELPTIVDLKTGNWSWHQLVAYWHCLPEYHQLAIFDLKNLKLEILKPKTLEAYNYWEEFLIKRGEVKAKFNI